MQSHYLHPSNCFVPRETTIVTTVLGSCISVCLFDKVEGKGGINHFMLPKWNHQKEASHMFGDYSIEELIKIMIFRGSLKENLVAKIFGGSHRNSSYNKIGHQNFEQAKETLSRHHIRIVAKSVGGEKARKIIFDTKSGLVKMKYISYDAIID
ncbi:MAG: chemotaxis protein CheD [Cytophagales bacterium]|nr:chemotaxis protein CheD [Cytophagales bacterium]